MALTATVTPGKTFVAAELVTNSKLNQLAGELLANPSMAAEDVQLSLLALAGLGRARRTQD